MLRHDSDDIFKAVSEQFIALRRLCKTQDTTLEFCPDLLQYFTSHPTHDEACGLTKPSLFFDFSKRNSDHVFLKKFHDSWRKKQQVESAGHEGMSAVDVLCQREFTGNAPQYEGTWKRSAWKMKDDDGRILHAEWVGGNFRNVEQQSKKCWRYRLVVSDTKTQQTEEAFPELRDVSVVLVTMFDPSDQAVHRNTQNRKRPRTARKRPSTGGVKMGPSLEELSEQIGCLEVRQDKLENQHEAMNKQIADVAFQLSKLTANEQHEQILFPSHDDPAQAVRTVFDEKRSQWLTKKDVAQALNTGQSLSAPNSQTINSILYDLQKKGILERNDQEPPAFRLTAVGSDASLDSTSSQIETGSTGLQETDLLNLKSAIRNVFEQDPSRKLKKRDVAKVLQTAVENMTPVKATCHKDINSALYSLWRDGVLEKDSQEPPNFRLKSVDAVSHAASSWCAGTWSTDPQRGGAALHCMDQIAAREDLPSGAMPATSGSVLQLDDDGESWFINVIGWDDPSLGHLPGASVPKSPLYATQDW